jgi:hypothetical protein
MWIVNTGHRHVYNELLQIPSLAICRNAMHDRSALDNSHVDINSLRDSEKEA